MRLRLFLPSLFCVWAFGIGAVAAADNIDQPVESLHVCERTAHYPREMIYRAREGWVVLRYTMKADGTYTDIEVMSVFGDPIFGELARNAFATCRAAEPEQFGPPGTEVRNLRAPYLFRVMSPPNRVKTRTKEQLDEARELLRTGQIDKAESLLVQAEKDSATIYEFTHLFIVRAALAAARNDINLALSYLDGVNFNKSFVSPKEFAQLLRMRLTLELREGQYVRAAKTATEMAEGPMEGDGALLGRLASLRDVVTKAESLTVNGKVPVDCHPAFCDPEKPTWSYSPYNRTVSLADIQGRLDKVMLRCNRKTAEFAAAPGVTWTIPKSWGDCAVEVTGEPGATFSLIDETIAG